jgi:hypothetical protein
MSLPVKGTHRQNRHGTRRSNRGGLRAKYSLNKSSRFSRTSPQVQFDHELVSRVGMQAESGKAIARTQGIGRRWQGWLGLLPIRNNHPFPTRSAYTVALRVFSRKELRTPAMRLYSGTTASLIEDTTKNRIATKLSDSFFHEFRFQPAPSEVNSWRNSLRAGPEVAPGVGFGLPGCLAQTCDANSLSRSDTKLRIIASKFSPVGGPGGLKTHAHWQQPNHESAVGLSTPARAPWPHYLVQAFWEKNWKCNIPTVCCQVSLQD